MNPIVIAVGLTIYPGLVAEVVRHVGVVGEAALIEGHGVRVLALPGVPRDKLRR